LSCYGIGLVVANCLPVAEFITLDRRLFWFLDEKIHYIWGNVYAGVFEGVAQMLCRSSSSDDLIRPSAACVWAWV
jgi:hypothetical protein